MKSKGRTGAKGATKERDGGVYRPDRICIKAGIVDLEALQKVSQYNKEALTERRAQLVKRGVEASVQEELRRQQHLVKRGTEAELREGGPRTERQEGDTRLKGTSRAQE